MPSRRPRPGPRWPCGVGMIHRYHLLLESGPACWPGSVLGAVSPWFCLTRPSDTSSPSNAAGPLFGGQRRSRWPGARNCCSPWRRSVPYPPAKRGALGPVQGWPPGSSQFAQGGGLPEEWRDAGSNRAIGLVADRARRRYKVRRLNWAVCVPRASHTAPSYLLSSLRCTAAACDRNAASLPTGRSSQR
jgi:hypothetical protein